MIRLEKELALSCPVVEAFEKTWIPESAPKPNNSALLSPFRSATENDLNDTGLVTLILLEKLLLLIIPLVDSFLNTMILAGKTEAIVDRCPMISCLPSLSRSFINA